MGTTVSGGAGGGVGGGRRRVVRDVLLCPGCHVVGGRQILEREEEAGIASVLPGHHLVGIEGKHPQQELRRLVAHDTGIGFVQSHDRPGAGRPT